MCNCGLGFNNSPFGDQYCQRCGYTLTPAEEYDLQQKERMAFTASFEIGDCKDCRAADVWCEYHTNKMARLGLNSR